MKEFNVYHYQSFIKLWQSHPVNIEGDVFLRQHGFKSAIFKNGCWAMNKEDFYLFHFLWCNL